MGTEMIWAEEAVLIVFATVNWFLAKRLEKSPWIWSVLTIIPVIGFIVNYVLLYTTLFSLLDSIEALEAHRLHSRGLGTGTSR
jgi:hypothetical protein